MPYFALSTLNTWSTFPDYTYRLESSNIFNAVFLQCDIFTIHPILQFNTWTRDWHSCEKQNSLKMQYLKKHKDHQIISCVLLHPCPCISLLCLSRSSCNVMSSALSCFRKPWLGRMQRRCRTCSIASTTDKLRFIIRYAKTRVADLLRPITQCTSTLSRTDWRKDGWIH